MPSSSIEYETVAAAAAVMLVYLYAALWALNIRRKLSVRLYRHQALGVGLVAICIAYFSFFIDVPVGHFFPSASQFPLDELFVTFLACPLPLLYWTDSSLLAARDSDPLQRDVLGWSRVRNILKGAVVVSLVAGGAYTIYQIIFLTQATIQAGSSEYLVGVPGILNFVAFLVPLVVPFAVVPIFLPVAVRRTKDLTLRRHLKWFMSGGALLLLGAVAGLALGLGVAAASSPLILVFPLALFGTSAYCFYRSARAVIPIYSFKEGAS